MSSFINDSACHMEAAMRHQDIYRNYIGRNTEKSVLDFGCGPTGAGRTFIEGQIMGTRNKLSLFDPGADISPPNLSNVSIVGSEDVFGPSRKQFDVVNLSYVLCFMEPEEAKATLVKLKEEHGSSAFVIVDYTLATRSQMEVQNLLKANTELKWREKLGEDEFYRTHSRFTQESLSSLAEEAGIVPARPNSLDSKGLRAYIAS